MSNINVNNLTPLLGSGSSVSVSGSLVVKNDVTIGGHLYIGDQDNDNVKFSAEVSSSVIPNNHNVWDLGSLTKQWSSIYVDSLVTHHITASGNISASGTGVNGTGSFHHITVNGDVTASGTGSFQQGVIANQSSSFTYISMSGALKTAYHVSASKLQLTKTAEIYGSASMGYISSSGDLTASGTGSFGGGIDSSTATGSFGQVTVEGDVSSSATGSFMDVFIDDNLEVQGDVNIHGNISASGTATASFGHISASGDISTSTAVHSVQYFTDSLLALTGNQAINTVKLGGASSVSQLHGLSIDVTGSVSMSGVLHTQLNGNGALPTIDNDTVAIFQRNLPGNSSAAVSIIGHAAGESILKLGDTNDEDIGRIRYQHTDDSMDFHTNNTQQMSIDSSGNVEIVGSVSSSGRVSASGGFETDAGTTSNFGNISMSGAITLTGDISASRVSASAGFEADSDSKSTFGHISMSGDLQIGNNTVVVSGSVGQITASGNISGGAQVFGGDYYAQGLQFATQADNQSSGVLQIGGSAPMRIKGTSLMVTGSISMSGALSMSGANANISTDQGSIYAGSAISSSEHLIGALIQQHTAGVTNFAVDSLGQVTASGQISSSAGLSGTALTLTTAGVHKASIDASGNVAAEGAISSSGDVAGRSLTLTSNGAHFASIDASGNVAAEGNISSSGTLGGTDLELTAAGVHKAKIDASGNIAAEGKISSSQDLHGTHLTLATDGVNALTVAADGDLTTTGTISSSNSNPSIFRALSLKTNGESVIDLIANGVISASGVVQGTALKAQTNGDTKFVVDTSGNLSSSGTLAGTALTLATNGDTYASINALGTGSFLGGIDAGSLNTISSSFGYISASADISTSGAIYGETLIVGAGNSIVNGNIKFNGGIVRPLKSITGDIVLDATSGVTADAGKTIVLNAAGGCSVVLPAASGTGNVYEFYVGTAITSNSYVIKVADSTDTFIGAVHMIDADDDSQTSITAKGTDDTLTLNGGTTGGGLLGDTIKFTDIATNKYVVQGNIIVVAGSNPADPFSATVS
jgi:hypothetical protein